MRIGVLILVFLTFPWSVAFAADLSKARDHYTKGTRAYELGLWDEAIAEYMAAYKEKDDPALLFNLGQAHRLAGHASEALRFYKTYLSKVPEAANRAEVEAKMRDLSAQLAKEPADGQGVPATPTANAPPASGVNTAEPPADQGDQVPNGQVAAATGGEVPVAGLTSSPAGGTGMKWAGISVAAAGGVLVGAGIVFGILAKREGDDLTQIDQQHGVFDPGKESNGRRDQVLEAIFIGTGVAALATGTVLYLLGMRDAAPTSVALAPARGGGATATLRLAF